MTAQTAPEEQDLRGRPVTRADVRRAMQIVVRDGVGPQMPTAGPAWCSSGHETRAA